VFASFLCMIMKRMVDSWPWGWVRSGSVRLLHQRDEPRAG
jgi:hypothetical protein